MSRQYPIDELKNRLPHWQYGDEWLYRFLDISHDDVEAAYKMALGFHAQKRKPLFVRIIHKVIRSASHGIKSN